MLIQVALAIGTATQGPLLFTYKLISISSLKTLWIWKIILFCCCKSKRDNTIDIAAPTTDTSAQSSQAAILNFTIKASSKHKGSKMIATDTNPAYESVMLRRKKEEYTMTENELYGILK